MELVHIIKSLWRSKALVAVGAVLALAVAVAFGMRGQTVTGGTASADVLIDSQESAIGDLRHDTLPLVARSGILAQILGADGATHAIAHDAGIPVNEIAVIGPELTIEGVPDQASAERATKLSESARYLVQIQHGDGIPVLTILTRAPTTAEARRLADATAAALKNYVADYQERAVIPEKRRVTIRQLGPARAGEFKEAPSAILPFVVFLAIFGLWCFAILAWPRIKAAWRSSEASGAPLLGAPLLGAPLPPYAEPPYSEPPSLEPPYSEPSSSLIVIGGAGHRSNGGHSNGGATPDRRPALPRSFVGRALPPARGDEPKAEDEDIAAELEPESPESLASKAKRIFGY